MPARVTVHSHVQRALNFYNQPDIWVGIGKTTAWTNNLVPPTPSTSAVNIGQLDSEVYSGSSVNSTNVSASLNTSLFVLGAKSYRVNILTASTFEVRDITLGTPGTVVGSASYTQSSTAYTNIVTGLSILVTGTSFSVGDYYQFNVAGATAFKLVSLKYIVKPDPAGTILYNGQNWAIVSPANAYTDNARWVYIQSVLQFTEVPVGEYRQVGIFTGLQRVSGSATALLPSEVASTGVLHVLDNRGVVTRDSNSVNSLEYIIEF